ncbi:MAG: DNA-formamidopyrimidine glycosylase [Candidatus Omnitrophica bacterium]|nr:DNA-formamidopyrimidine glycosylase [Candidatus Omnitrophota bacterium]
MPELPDVEYYRRYLESTAMRKKIKSVEVQNAKVLEGVSAKKLAKVLKNKKFTSTHRRGKNLFVSFAKDKCLYMHFGMTGELKYFKGDEKEPDHARVLFGFSNGYRLAFMNQRLLGKVSVTGPADEVIAEKDLGPDALEISYEDFKKGIKGKIGAVKSALMDQSILSGVGNIYADEILFHARIHPKTTPKKLSGNALKRIYRNMKKILEKAIEKKADPDKFPRTWIIPARGEKEKCPRCGGGIKRIKISGRSSYFCPRCQKK